MKNGHGKSDRPEVPTKSPNNGERQGKPGHGGPYTGTKAETPDTAKGTPKAEQTKAASSAEGMEGRGLAKGNSPRQNTRRIQRRGSVPSALGRVRQAATLDKGLRFTALLHHVTNLEALREAYFRLNPKAAPGIDGTTWRQYGETLEENLRDLSARLKRGAYRAKPVQRRYIPKEDGKRRPIGIPTLEDKVVQMAVVEVLNAVYEVDFLGFSYGFRPGRGQHHALDALSTGLMERKVNWVFDADIRGFFDAINHGWLMKFIEHRIADRRVLRLIQKWLNAGVLEEGKRVHSEEGTPQGGSISPLLANIFLHYAFDLWVHQWRQKQCQGDVIVVRYADDFLVCFQHRDEAERFQSAIGERFAKFGLELHPDKTRLIEFGRSAEQKRRALGRGKLETFGFLGFTHYCGSTRAGAFQVKRRTMRKRLQRKLKEVAEELRLRMHDPVPEQGKYLKAVVDGHFRYYGVPFNYRALSSFRHGVVWHWRRALSRRSQKAEVTWERMYRLAARWLPRPRIYHPHPEKRFAVRTQGKSPVR